MDNPKTSECPQCADWEVVYACSMCGRNDKQSFPSVPRKPTLDELAANIHTALTAQNTHGADCGKTVCCHHYGATREAIDALIAAAKEEGRRADTAEEALMECRLSSSKLAQDNLTIGASMAREERHRCAEMVRKEADQNRLHDWYMLADAMEAPDGE